MKIVVVVRRTGDDECKVKAEASDANEAVRMRPTTESIVRTRWGSDAIEPATQQQLSVCSFTRMRGAEDVVIYFHFE
jgi:hypothetical protein